MNLIVAERVLNICQANCVASAFCEVACVGYCTRESQARMELLPLLLIVITALATARGISAKAKHPGEDCKEVLFLMSGVYLYLSRSS